MADINLGNGCTARWENGWLVIMADDVRLQTRLDGRNLFMASVRVMRALRQGDATGSRQAMTTAEVASSCDLMNSHAHEALKSLSEGGLVCTAADNKFQNGQVWWLSPADVRAGGAP